MLRRHLACRFQPEFIHIYRPCGHQLGGQPINGHWKARSPQYKVSSLSKERSMNVRYSSTHGVLWSLYGVPELEV